jgi:predicted 3-demethylubiquinone-9 3-methyltransferase (glyoxalase superfamily)
MPSAKLNPFLMFDGHAEEAIDFYVSLFEDGEVLDVVRFGPDGPGAEGSIMRALFVLGGQPILATDSFVKHDFGFTPSFSLFVEVNSAEDVDRLSAALSDGGQVLMAAGTYGFSARYAWVNDRYGVSWQINFA